MSSTQKPLEFTGHTYLRQILTLSLLSGRQIIVKNIRADEDSPGLRPHEINLLQLIEKVTNGTQVSINKTGTRLIMHPGIIDSNEGLLVEHDCHLDRAISYYLEVVCPVACFGKNEMNLMLSGNTDSNSLED